MGGTMEIIDYLFGVSILEPILIVQTLQENNVLVTRIGQIPTLTMRAETRLKAMKVAKTIEEAKKNHAEQLDMLKKIDAQTKLEIYKQKGE